MTFASSNPPDPGSHLVSNRAFKVEPIEAPIHRVAEIETVITSLGREPGGGLPTSAGNASQSSDACQAASSSRTGSSPSGALPRRGPLANAASISFTASVSVMRCTAEISRDNRSSAAS